MPRRAHARTLIVRMYARAADEVAERLHELQREQWEDFALAAVAVGLALAATRVSPAFAVPLLLGGFGVGVRGVRALWRRWDLVDRLAGDRDAFVIPDVRAYASRAATVERRLDFAATIRSCLRRAELTSEARISALAEELEGLACELEDGGLAFDPASAVMCMRLLSDVDDSPLLDPTRPPEELRSRICQIRSGFTPILLAAGSRVP